MKNLLKIVLFLSGIAFAAVAAYASYEVFVHGNMLVTEEDGPIEILQALILALSLVLFLRAAFVDKWSERAIVLFCAMICYAGILREVDFDKMELGAFADFMLYGAGRHATIILGFAAILGYAAYHWRRYLKSSIRFLGSSRGILWIGAGLLIFLSQEIEHSDIQYAQFYEEITELVAYYLILSSSVLMLRGNPAAAEESASEKTEIVEAA